MKENIPLLKEVVSLRSQIASLLGYKSWAEVKLETKMAKTPETVINFLSRLDQGLYPKLKSELDMIQAKKREMENNPKVNLALWDVAFYFDKIAKEKYQLDSEEVKKYFPLDESIKGMFNVYQSIFGIKFHEITPPYKWVDDIQLYVVVDEKSQKPLGMFYLDLFPRKGKYTHFAMFPIIGGGKTSDGVYHRPTVALVCNFPKPGADSPSLLPHSDLETLFHEFGHAMHAILSTANRPSFAGTSVPRDFVEAPSQMFENWVWNKQVLDTFARHYKTGEKFPLDLLDKMTSVKQASTGRDNMFQLAIGTVDMKLHSLKKNEKIDVVKESNKIFENVFELFKNKHV